MLEIGGYLQLDQLINKPYYPNLIDLNIGRNALLYIIKSKNITQLHIPSYICDSITNMLIDNNIKIEFYSINNDFTPILNTNLKNKFILIINYFGQISNDFIIKTKAKFPNIIIDNTHSFFQNPVKNIDTFYSCRKFFGVPDGAYLQTDKFLEDNLDIDSSYNRMNHIIGRYEINAKQFYSDFKLTEDSFKSLTLKKMSRITNNILGAIDYSDVIQKRNLNYNYLHFNLEQYNKIALKSVNGPFSYPFYIENGIEVREKLVEKNIYIPILWPNILKLFSKNSQEYRYATNILPLPCDQRYSYKELEYLTKNIKLCID